MVIFSQKKTAATNEVLLVADLVVFWNVFFLEAVALFCMCLSYFSLFERCSEG